MKLRSFLPALFAIAATSSFAQQHALGIAFNGDLFKVNISTGQGVFVANTGIAQPNCMASYQGSWYTVDNQARLWRISETGATTLVYQMNLGGATNVRGLAFEANAKTYVVVDQPASDELWEIHPVNGAGTLIGPMGSTTIQGLAIDINGDMVAYDISTLNSGGLKVVNRATGLATDVNPNVPGQPGIQDIFPSGGGIMGGRDSLFNFVAGTENLIGTGGYADIRGWARKQTAAQINSATVKLGQLAQGNSTSLRHSDGNLFRVNKFIVPNQQVDPINVEVDVSSALTHANSLAMGVRLLIRTTTSGPFFASIDVFNRVTNAWEQIGVNGIGTSFNFALGSTSGNQARYFDAFDHALFRFRVKPNGPIGSSNWGIEADIFRVEDIENF